MMRNNTVKTIVDDFWNRDIDKALSGAGEYIENQPGNPLGYFLRGAIYQSISEGYRNDSFKDSIYNDLDKAIELCNDLKDDYPDNPVWYFIVGSSYGYRGLHKAFHGSWWSAFKDGFRCSSNLEKALELDSTFYDAYLGLGSYHYYKTVKAKDFIWLPFVSDRREEGQNEIRLAIDSGYLAKNLAREGLLRIGYLEGRHKETVYMADSLLVDCKNEPYALLYKIESLTELESFYEADQLINEYYHSMKTSVYFDSLGIYEADLLRAKYAYKKGNGNKAMKIIDHILDMDDARDENAYFNDTYERAEKLKKIIK